MTKSILVTLVLVGLSLGIMWVWFSDRPMSDPDNIGAQAEQTQNVAEDSSGPSRLSRRDKVTTSLDTNVNRNSRATCSKTRSALVLCAHPDA